MAFCISSVAEPYAKYIRLNRKRFFVAEDRRTPRQLKVISVASTVLSASLLDVPFFLILSLNNVFSAIIAIIDKPLVSFMALYLLTVRQSDLPIGVMLRVDMCNLNFFALMVVHIVTNS